MMHTTTIYDTTCYVTRYMQPVACTCNANTLRVTCNPLQVTRNAQTLTRNGTQCRRDTKLWVKVQSGRVSHFCCRGHMARQL